MNVPTHVLVSCFDFRDSNVSKPKHTKAQAAQPCSLVGTSGEPQPQSVPHLECTYMYCETPKEPKCLKYKTEKN